jgi:DNA-binding NarL/FixJ family response regulator
VAPATATAGVVAGPALRVAAVAAVLEGASVPVLQGDAAVSADVLVLIDPEGQEWEQVRASGRPAVALLAEDPDDDQLIDLVEAGACAVLVRSCASSQLVDTLGRVAAGESGLTRRQSRGLVDALRARSSREVVEPAPLTGREHEILTAIGAGLSVKQTAERLRISPRTVENTQRLLFRKLGVRNRSQAVARALDAGLLDATPNPELP